MKYIWKTLKDGSYEKEYQIVDAVGRICGEVYGRNYCGPITEWNAVVFPINKPAFHLGYFITEAKAKLAVETKLKCRKDRG
jgi:hypothetical protein